LALFQFDSAAGTLIDTGIAGTVDASGATATFSGVTHFSTYVAVLDGEAPVIAEVTASPNILWPPNHGMVPVSLAVSVTDRADPAPTCRISEVTSNEARGRQGSGSTAVDWTITGPLTAVLRAERSGGGSGRIYTLTIECRDAAGNSATATALVTVPHDRSR